MKKAKKSKLIWLNVEKKYVFSAYLYLNGQKVNNLFLAHSFLKIKFTKNYLWRKMNLTFSSSVTKDKYSHTVLSFYVLMEKMDFVFHHIFNNQWFFNNFLIYDRNISPSFMSLVSKLEKSFISQSYIFLKDHHKCR